MFSYDSGRASRVGRFHVAVSVAGYDETEQAYAEARERLRRFSPILREVVEGRPGEQPEWIGELCLHGEADEPVVDPRGRAAPFLCALCVGGPRVLQETLLHDPRFGIWGAGGMAA